MEKEKKYTAIIAIISSGLCVAIIIVVGLLLFYPDGDALQIRDTIQEGDTEPEIGALLNPYDYLKNPAEVTREVEVESAEEPEIVFGERIPPKNEIPGLISARTETIQPTQEIARTPSNRPSTPQIITRTPAATDAREPQREGAQKSRGTPTNRPPTSRPPRSVAQKPPASASTAPAPSAKPKDSPTKIARASSDRRPTPSRSAAPTSRYWIQVFSSDKYEHAERARAQLAEYQLEGVISNYHNDGTRYYRLRIGPYQKYGEAQKFLGWVNQTETFDAGYVVKVTNP